jgi:hypothetical protein
VVRKIALSRENPQYEQLFTHSFETYNGANKRMVFPKCRRVTAALSRASVSSETWGSNIAIKRRTNGDGRDMRSSN